MLEFEGVEESQWAKSSDGGVSCRILPESSVYRFLPLWRHMKLRVPTGLSRIYACKLQGQSMSL
jgi:hypothetical protein